MKMRIHIDSIGVMVNKCVLNFVRTYDERVCVYAGYDTRERDEEPNRREKWIGEQIARQHFGTLEKIRMRNWVVKKKKTEYQSKTGDLF